MKRNKRTEIMAHEDLTPLTEHILAKMGKEGQHGLRRRLGVGVANLVETEGGQAQARHLSPKPDEEGGGLQVGDQVTEEVHKNHLAGRPGWRATWKRSCFRMGKW